MIRQKPVAYLSPTPQVAHAIYQDGRVLTYEFERRTVEPKGEVSITRTFRLLMPGHDGTIEELVTLAHVDSEDHPKGGITQRDVYVNGASVDRVPPTLASMLGPDASQLMKRVHKQLTPTKSVYAQ
jgi:hypothetical protein